MQRRQTIQFIGAAALAGATLGCAHISGQAKPQVVVVGGGFAGAAVAKYVRLTSLGRIDVTLVEPASTFVSCPMSNLVLGGSWQMADISKSYQTLVARHGVRWLRARARAVDPDKRLLHLDNGQTLSWQRLVLAPGVDMMYDHLAGWREQGDGPLIDGRPAVLHAWKAGPQTLALRAQLRDLKAGGVFVITVPQLPFRCPPAPYERACQVAAYFRQANPRAKIIILDANDDIAAEAAQFRHAFAALYGGMIEYRSGFQLAQIDLARQMVFSEFDDKVHYDLLNLIPPQRAGAIAHDSDLANINARWCEVDFLSFASRSQPLIHVLGDAIQSAPQMPKAGQMAVQQARVCAQAITAQLLGTEGTSVGVNPAPLLESACYSFVAPELAIHLASLHAWDAAQQTFLPVPGHTRLSPQATAQEAAAARRWAEAIWREVLE